MDTGLIIGTSILLQIIAAIFALLQIRDIELRRVWLAIASALVLMTIPRSVTLAKMAFGHITHPPALETELISLDVSFLMGIGIAYAAHLFRSLRKAHQQLLHSQQSLLDSETRLRILFDNAPDAILTLDKDGIVTHANYAAEALMGIEREDILNRPHHALPLFYARVASQNQAIDYKSLCMGSRTVEIDFFDAQNRTVHAEVRGFETSVNGASHHILIARDVTEQKALRAEADRLEAQLRHAERLQTVGTLAAGIAHDFNNILTPIMGYTELAMQQWKETPVTRGHLEHVLQGAIRAKDLVKQILAFSRKAEQRPISVQLQPLIQETLILLKASLPSTIEIQMDIDPDCRTVQADPAQLHQVLMNLCTNAYCAMRDKGGTLTIRLTECEHAALDPMARLSLRDGSYACLSIRDTGCGMDPSTLSRIFEPFFSTNADGRGTGLGLSVTHGIVSAHGGTILVDSELGVGTEFRVYLPIDARPMRDPLLGEDLPVTGTERVLLVDDDPEIVRLISEMLSSWGFRVTESTSAIEALETFRTKPDDYDVIVTNQTMPRMTGVELASEMKSIRPDIPLILMTGYCENISPENFRSLGFEGYLVKPILAGTLTRMIRSLTHAASLDGAME
jgi:PAS domain S-box-containing protein